jgi:hypothetical protein
VHAKTTTTPVDAFDVQNNIELPMVVGQNSNSAAMVVRQNNNSLLKNFNKNCRNISIFTNISYITLCSHGHHFLFFQHNQQHDTALSTPPCTHKPKAGIAYSVVPNISCYQLFFSIVLQF